MKQVIFSGLVILVMAFGIESCSPASGNSPGHEYMPDMAHSIAQESNVYNEYSLHTWDKDSTKAGDRQSVKSLKELSVPRNPEIGRAHV